MDIMQIKTNLLNDKHEHQYLHFIVFFSAVIHICCGSSRRQRTTQQFPKANFYAAVSLSGYRNHGDSCQRCHCHRRRNYLLSYREIIELGLTISQSYSLSTTNVCCFEPINFLKQCNNE